MKNLLKFLVVAALLALFAGYAWRRDRRSEVVFSGTVEADVVHVASRYGGRVVELPFQEGDLLRKGDLIAGLSAPELEARRERLAARLLELENGPRPEEIEAARRDWEALKAQLAYAESERIRNRELYAQKAVASTDAERTEAEAEKLCHQTAAAEARYALLKEGTRKEELAQARAELAEVEANLAELRVTAPQEMVMELLSVKPGDVVPANRELATLLLPSLWMRVYVPTPWLSRIALGQETELRVDGLEKPVFRGVVEQISREAEFTPRNVQTEGDRLRQVFGVKIRLANPDGHLRAGMSGVVRFLEKP